MLVILNGREAIILAPWIPKLLSLISNVKSISFDISERIFFKYSIGNLVDDKFNSVKLVTKKKLKKNYIFYLK